MRYALHQITPERLALVEDAWKEVAGADEFVVEMAEKFSNAHRDLADPATTSRYLEVQDASTGEAHAVLDMIDAQRISTTKLLSIWTSPKYWGDGLTASELRQAVVELYAQTFMMLLAQTTSSSSKVDIIKLYGRADEMFTILATLNEVWDGNLKGWSSEIQGRWLVLTRS